MNYTPQAGNWQQEQQQQGVAAADGTAAGSAREDNTIYNNNNQEEGGPSRSTFVTLVEDNDVLMGRKWYELFF